MKQYIITMIARLLAFPLMLGVAYVMGGFEAMVFVGLLAIYAHMKHLEDK